MKPYIFKVVFSAFLFIHTITALAQVAAVKFIVHTPDINKEDREFF
jgi:hypothetical protein